MKFTIGDKVSCKGGTRTKGSEHYNKWGSPDHKGIIVMMGYENGISGSIYFTVRNTTNVQYNYNEKELTIAKVQKLYAYVDSTEEVHWATKQYIDKELDSFGFKREAKFDKSIDLE